MYRLIAIDLDGTLLNSCKEVSEANIIAVKQAVDKGVKVVICSGRIFAGARIFAKQMGIKEPLIACNGAIIRDMESEEILHSDSLRIEDCFKIVDICHKEDVYFHIYIGDTMYTERLEYSALFYWNKNMELAEKERVDIRVVDDIYTILSDNSMPVSKFVVISDHKEQLARARKGVSEISTVDVMSSFHNNFEVVNMGVNKGNALKYLSERLGIKRDEIVAIGDNENDYSMIEFAGLGVAMGNAESEIKEIADYITFSNDQDGVSHTIKRFVLDI